MNKSWKDCERRVCRQLGGDRRGPTGKDHSDCVGTPWAVEVKKTKSGAIERAHIEQARRHSKLERKPWILVNQKTGTQEYTATCELKFLLEALEDQIPLKWEAPDAGLVAGREDAG